MCALNDFKQINPYLNLCMNIFLHNIARTTVCERWEGKREKYAAVKVRDLRVCFFLSLSSTINSFWRESIQMRLLRLQVKLWPPKISRGARVN